MKVECEFRMTKWGSTERYTCHITEIVITQPESSITAFKGIHQEGKTNNNVEALFIHNQRVEFWPRGFGANFSNLILLEVGNCGLKEINKQDLLGLKKLELFSLPNNELKLIPDDLFQHTRKLGYICLCGNNIEEVSSKLFNLLVKENLTSVDFQGNPSINYRFKKSDESTTLEALIKKIDENCVPPGNVPAIKIDFSDFTIKLRGDEFKVHKHILSSQSSVFKSLFTNNEERLKILKITQNIKRYSNDVIKNFLHYFYTRKIFRQEHAITLLELACLFDVTEMKLDCEQIVIGSLNDTNMLAFYNLGRLQGLQKLKLAAFKFIAGKVPELSDNMLDEHELIKDFVITKQRLEKLKRKCHEMLK